MIRKAFSIRDQKSGTYAPPNYFTNEQEAERAFHAVINKSDTMYNAYAQDYDLFHVGDFDDNTGQFIGLDTPTHVNKGIHLKGKDL